MRIFVQHTTEYFYDEPVLLGPHVVRLRPSGHTRAVVESYNLAVDRACQVRWQYDPWGNQIARLTFAEGAKVDSFRLTMDACFDIQPVNPFDFFVDDRCEMMPFRYPDGLEVELAPYLTAPEASSALAEFVETVPTQGKTTDYLVALNRAVADRVNYVIREEAGIQTSEQTLTAGLGSCRDSARLLVDVLRSRGLAARFVSGYLVQLADEGIVPDLPRGMDRDVVDLHAWAEVYLPGAGWIGLDGTSGLFCGEGHIPLASTVSPELAAPVSGTASSPSTRMNFEMTVRRVGHEPRPRMPYTDEQWQALCSAGDRIDGILEGRGVFMTCGGEPTFTSREHPHEPEWITGAVGPTKWQHGLRLADELRKRFGDGVLVMHQMGKLYPGESLPRWILQLHWRPDGIPIWRDPARLDLRLDDSPRTALDDGACRAFASLLAARLGVEDQWMPGYEDPWVSILHEQNLPEDADPLTADLSDSEDRRRLARILDRGLGKEVGLALPIRRQGTGWATQTWEFRRGHLFLIPGDSPMGLRLPLDRISGLPPESYSADVTAVSEPLLVDPRQTIELASVAVDTKPPTVTRSTLCVEARDGVLHVFMPPTDCAEDFLALVAAAEDTAAELDLSVRIEGYGPPSDHRIRKCIVAPDPGVIEVNLPVCQSFAEYTDSVVMISDAANHAGLTMEKYQLDGREVGSGGGNHLTLGGKIPAESPFLRDPALLASTIRYLQNHPSLSYLFTGLFVGPTSQAPRLDEARHDALYEMELALSELNKLGTAAFPWQVDRILRNLLVDVSGNTHRTELCIDKLYDPATLAGRQGIIELRAFEMPPHERMAAAQMLLLRGLMARFAHKPYDAPLVRWGSRLHDQFMLPHYLWADFKDVVADLSEAGVPLQEEWYEPFIDHRCPRIGRRQIGDVCMELRTALEPWPTLGEQPSGPVVARYVDASLERVELKVTGMVPGRHVVAVNGIALPLHATGVASEAVAGVRFRAWQPPECLHPTIGMHHPLRFDLIDSWSKRALGGCTYHVVHPEGQGYDEQPLTAFEAAARRAQRFSTEGHSPWPAPCEIVEPHPEQPFSLDLRRIAG